MKCEMCHKQTADGWYCLDDNAEVELCEKCARELRSEMKVEAFS